MSEGITLLDGLRRQLRDRPDAAAFSVGPRTLSSPRSTPRALASRARFTLWA